MKKTLKQISLLLLAFAMFFSLCSCFDLDAMRKTHAKWQEDGTIVLNGQVYKKISTPDNFDLVGRLATDLILTEADVPLLLAEVASTPAYLDQSGRFISYYHYPNLYMDTTPSIGYRRYYCREDCYSEVINAIANDQRDYFYSVVMTTDEYDEALYFLSEEEAEAIKESLATTGNRISYNTNDYDEYYTYYVSSSYSLHDLSIELERRSADGLFIDPDFSSYCILSYNPEDDTYFVTLKNDSGERIAWKISAEYNDLFDELRDELENYN